MRDHRLSLTRERYTRSLAVEQIATKDRLQALDLRTDRRLSNAKRLRRLGEAAQINHSDKRAQQIGWNIRHQRPSTSACANSFAHKHLPQSVAYSSAAKMFAQTGDVALI